MNMEQERIGWTFGAQWAGLTILGGLAGHYISDALDLGFDQGILFAMLGSGIYSLLISVFQWVILRQQFSNSGWWLLAGFLGRAIGVMAGWITSMYISYQFNF